MNISADMFSAPWLATGMVAYGALLSWALAGIDHRRLQRQPHRQHLLLAGSVAVMSLWLARSAVMPGVGVHILGMTSLTLLLGWRQALVGSLFPLGGSVLVGAEPWQTMGVAGLVLAVLPIAVSYGVWRGAERILPRNMLVYLLVCVLFGSALAAASVRLAGVGLLALTDAQAIAGIGPDYLALLSLMLLPETLINVAVIAALAACRPQWLATLDSKGRGSGRPGLRSR